MLFSDEILPLLLINPQGPGLFSTLRDLGGGHPVTPKKNFAAQKIAAQKKPATHNFLS